VIEFNLEQKIRHGLINIISNNYAMVYLEKKNIFEAIQDCRILISEAFIHNKISKDTYTMLLESINRTFDDSDIQTKTFIKE
jgi:hypothetical protein